MIRLWLYVISNELCVITGFRSIKNNIFFLFYRYFHNNIPIQI